MKTVVLVFHPDLNTSRINSRLATEVQKDQTILVRDMYQVYPERDIIAKEEQAILEGAERIVLQFPMYWYSSPALLKQWEDAVFEYGWAYGSTGDKLHGKEMVIAVTPGASESNYVRDENFKYTVTDLLRPFQATSNLIGTKFMRPFVVSGTMDMEDAVLEDFAKNYREYVTSEELDILGDYE
jgi:putative NADPH-quinone reductase